MFGDLRDQATFKKVSAHTEVRMVRSDVSRLLTWFGRDIPMGTQGIQTLCFSHAFLPLLGCEKGSFSSGGTGFGFAWKVGGLVVFVVDPRC